MKRLISLASVLAFSCCLHAQTVDTTVCDILKNPQSFNDKTVRLKGTVVAGFDQFVIQGADCGQRVDAIWLSYPEGIKAKAGPMAVLQMRPARNFAGTVAPVSRTPVQLDKNNKDFKQFDSWLAAPFKSDGMCLGCRRYTVTATLVGRLDGVEAGLQREKTGKVVAINGFGNLNAYSARLVLQSVSDVASHEIDHSKTAAVTKGETLSDNGSTDPVKDAHNIAHVFNAGNPLADKIERAAAAFGKQGDHNGVDLEFGVPNQATAKEDSKGNDDSSDGVLYTFRLDQNRTNGAGMNIAVAYAGTLIADLRDQKPGLGPYELEYDAWQTAIADAVGNRLKTFTLPGEHLLWNTAWSADDRNRLPDEGLKSFLADEELLSR